MRVQCSSLFCLLPKTVTEHSQLRVSLLQSLQSCLKLFTLIGWMKQADSWARQWLHIQYIYSDTMIKITVLYLSLIPRPLPDFYLVGVEKNQHPGNGLGMRLAIYWIRDERCSRSYCTCIYIGSNINRYPPSSFMQKPTEKLLKVQSMLCAFL